MKIRLTTFARNDANLLEKFNDKYLNNSSKWKDIEFVTDSSYDKLIILTYPHKSTLENGYDERKAITFMTEPSSSPFATSHPSSHLIDNLLYLPFFPKEILGKKSIGGSGRKIRKNKILSTVTSELSGLEGHKLRLEFIYGLDKVFIDDFDIFGRPSNGSFFKLLNNYRGKLDDKYSGLWEYYYHFASENSFENNYFTEKIIDPLIAETLCFYSGCPNIAEFIDPRSYVHIDLFRPEEAVNTIINTIQDNCWKKSLKYIQSEKRRFLNELHPFNLIWMVAHQKDINKALKTGF